MCCGGRVFVQSRLIGNKRLPFFAHYKGGDPNCPWYHGRTIQPDEARAAQYGGQQELIAHRMMCEKVAEIVQLDPRCRRSNVNKYLPPTENAYGRFPDVFFEWAGLGIVRGRNTAFKDIPNRDIGTVSPLRPRKHALALATLRA